MKAKRARLPIITKRDEIPPGYVRLSTFHESDGRQGRRYGLLRRAAEKGELPAVKFYADGLASKHAPTYLDAAAAADYLDRFAEDPGPLFRKAATPAAKAAELEPMPATAAAVDALVASLARPGDPSATDRLAASLERIADALEHLTTGARLELALENAAE